jgi:hypothetical protein
MKVKNDFKVFPHCVNGASMLLLCVNACVNASMLASMLRQCCGNACVNASMRMRQ